MTAIEWCNVPGYAPEVWNPTTGCTSNGTGCDLCYARTLTNMRHKAYKAGKLQKMPHYAHPFSVVQLHPGRLANPLRVKRPTCYFVNSMSDLFHEEVPFMFVDQVFAVMAMCPQHIFIILTKRPERMREYTERGIHPRADGGHFIETMNESALLNIMGLPKEIQYPLPHVWMGASASTQAEVDAAVPHVLKTNAAVRLMSLEPLVEAVTLMNILGGTQWIGGQRGHAGQHHGDGSPECPRTLHHHHDDRCAPGLDWVIVGGESGTTKQKPRPMHPDWPRQVRDECKAAGVRFFFKQWGAWLPSYDAGERAHETANYGKSFGERWAANATSMRFSDGLGMVRAGKTANGHLLDGKEEFAWPIASPSSRGGSATKRSVIQSGGHSELDYRSPQPAKGGPRDDVKKGAR